VVRECVLKCGGVVEVKVCFLEAEDEAMREQISNDGADMAVANGSGGVAGGGIARQGVDVERG
jgi:hypothetical protein